eukprot:CAMPEP_0185578244 /NCGR_PEP_ID=MMETSP0434-20130131/12386_1 /TAXON_ID=626734 ORGANISM="Favella taraikaensis, Strain Fe Narragansett Bay" /NCGR_SAMPLE_ID=MMETSP0434 /ASSEMBLY_ACC=CAM_ASM_000379 /LENGTH=126 /DNA_ID=CAMNT_0028195999 /DNA_START=1013 /DNA_END=1393 /DNA_ORIENTATION=-
MNHLVRQLLLAEAGSLTTAARSREKGAQQVLLLRVQLRHAHVDHVPMIDAQFVELGCVALKQLLTEKEFLLFNLDLGLERDEALQVFDGAVVLAFNVVELVIKAQVLDHEAYHARHPCCVVHHCFP